MLAALLAGTVPILTLLLMIGMLAGKLGTGGSGGSFRPSATALADIPDHYLRLYMQAGKSRGLDWAILAAIGSVETDHGRSGAAGVRSGVNFAGCCAGPMQFSVAGPGGGTWGAYGVDGDHDGVKDVYDPTRSQPPRTS
jgi:hypothetical protein